MKSILYLLIVVFVGSMINSAIPMSYKTIDKNITIQCVDTNSSEILLDISADIIENRLKTYGITNFDMKISKRNSKINFSFKDPINLSKIKDLLTSKGKLEFYETIKRNEILKQIPKDDKIFSLLSIPTKFNKLTKVGSDAELGYCNELNKNKVDKYIYSLSKNNILKKDIKLVWQKTDGNKYSLYLLKKSSFVKGKYVSESQISHDKNSNSDNILINFNKKGGKLFQDLTKLSINKPLAIVFNNIVYSAPLVISEIKSGKCVLSGNFTKDEANCLVSIINNGELPLEFNFIK